MEIPEMLIKSVFLIINVIRKGRFLTESMIY